MESKYAPGDEIGIEALDYSYSEPSKVSKRGPVRSKKGGASKAYAGTLQLSIMS